MIKIGLIGGIGPESTIKYYQLIIKRFRELSNNKSYPEIIISSIDMTRMLKYISENNEKAFIRFMKERIDTLKKTGVEKIFICSNTPHVFFDNLQNQVDMKLVSIVEETINHIESLKLKRCGLIGTKFTMSKGFYSKKSETRNIHIVVPNEIEQDTIHDIYMNELVFNNPNKKSKETILKIIDRMKNKERIEGIILGGTELSLILDQTDFDEIKVLDTCLIHVESIVKELI
ncbi:aspartate/glutamate racemase family protein [Eudoraea chungangensis]|uniref:aspartate/glutamate racemase family protein n=1 Tax=Eudoraea chungangensis TaxID=1481905 RepID=UPI0023EB3489|nr:amino acid racemase [Eudoraea chungangensis]